MKHPRTIETFPMSRIATFDVGVIGRKKHQIVGLLEVDVSDARTKLRQMRRDGNAISLFSWFLKTVALSIGEMPQVHGVLRGRRRRVVYEAVDIAIVVERRVDGSPVPLPAIIRQCNDKSLRDIESEITAAATQPVDGTGDFQLGRRRSPLITRLFYSLPQFIRVAFLGGMMRNPDVRKASMGTVIVTSVAPGVRFPGWIIPRTMHNLAFGLGSVVRKPRVVGNVIVPRDVMHLTILFDHDVVDGAPAARFASRLVENLESAKALSEY